MKRRAGLAVVLALSIGACGNGGEGEDVGGGGDRGGGDAVSGPDVVSPDSIADGALADVVVDDGIRGPDLEPAELLVADASALDASSADSPGDSSGDSSELSSGCLNGVCPSVASVCVLACATPSDCVYQGTAPGGIYDEDNWVCKSGRCAHLGCLSDAECAEQPGLDYAPMKCVAVSGGYKSCLAACSAPADCPHPSRVDSPLYGADNYECKNGVCSYVGCYSDAECQAGIQGTGLNWVCSSEFWGFPMCSTPCNAPSDCTYLAGNPIFDADNYVCDQGICRHLGCQSDGECAEAYAATGLAYVCAESFIEP